MIPGTIVGAKGQLAVITKVIKDTENGSIFYQLKDMDTRRILWNESNDMWLESQFDK